MDEELSLDNIMTSEEANSLFDGDDLQDGEFTEENYPEENETENKKITETTEESESVGDEDEEEDTVDEEEVSSSPKTKKFYSSIAKAFADDGIFLNLSDEEINEVETPEDFRELVQKKIYEELDDTQKRIAYALNQGVEPTDISRLENTINYLSSISDEDIVNEGDTGENLRRQLIYQDYLNRGYSKERAERELQKSFNAGTDIEDAKEALKSNLEFFSSSYDNIIEEARQKKEELANNMKENYEILADSILNDDELYSDFNVSKSVRKNILKNILEPAYQDSSTGETYTEIQAYAKNNPVEYLKNIGLIFTLTNGFKNMGSILKGKVKSEVNKSIRELENTLKNSNSLSDGNLRYASGVSDSEYFNEEWTFDA